ncbi:hypothetical protein [Enterobacter ludwigii]|uniref:hypothetical protein n=1 Tax=Enterobacter ludwigii TaxID=299767 RepID=UPI003F717036
MRWKHRLARFLVLWSISLAKGGETMLAVYVMMIHKGVIELNDVPPQSREKVREVLELGGMDVNGNIV